MSWNIVQRLQTWTLKQIFIVFAAFLVYVLADGTTFSFGLYVDRLIDEYSKYRTKAVLSVSTIAALTQSVPLLLSPLVCWSTTKYGPSAASLIGCLVASSGYLLPFVLQFTRSFWVPAISYGVLLSTGLAFCYVPAYLTLPGYFEDDRGLATGLAVSGSGVGQVLLAMGVKTFIIEYGWRGASLITGGLFLFMLVSVVAFRKSPSSSPSSAVPPADQKEEILVPSVVIKINDESPTDRDVSIDHASRQRSRGMTLANVLPLLLSSIPVHTSLTIPAAETTPVRRHSLDIRVRTRTISNEPSLMPPMEMKRFQRARSNTIAVPTQTMRRLHGSIERIRISSRQQALAPIASTEENSDEEENLSLPSVSSSESHTSEIAEKSNETKLWLLNGRFLLFCFSNFALCLVMGVPYVILPPYIAETFVDPGYLSSWTLSNVGIASAVGQIVLGYLHDRKIFRAWLMYTFAVITSGTSLLFISLFRSKVIVLICGFLYGLAISANYALQVLIVIDTLTMDHMANAFGILQFCQGISTLIGIPFQGLLRDLTKTYRLSFLTSGLIIIFSGLVMLFWPCLKPKEKSSGK